MLPANVMIATIRDSSMQDSLPQGFSDLECWLDWARPTELGRNHKRWASSLEESKAFYDAMHKKGADALSYLNQFELGQLDEAQRTLLNMCLALAEVSATVEMYENPTPKYVFPIDRFVPVHDTWPLASSGLSGKQSQ